MDGIEISPYFKHDLPSLFGILSDKQEAKTTGVALANPGFSQGGNMPHPLWIR